jgi:predicted acyltransferase
LPVPGVGPANLEKATNLGAWVDRTLFGTNHLWSQSKTWDPEGLLGTIPAIGTCIIGLLTGTFLKQEKLKTGKEILQMTGAGVLLIIGGLVWNIFFPINKALWTSSFVLYTTGLAITILSICYWVIDVKGYKKLTYPFLAFGSNAITTLSWQILCRRYYQLSPLLQMVKKPIYGPTCIITCLCRTCPL